MATYAIGDIHGCFQAFLDLLDRVGFDAEVDRIWQVGDLVNGGPSSLEVVRWFRDHDEVVTTVLGNHDLHLLAVAYGVHRPRAKDTLGPLLEAADAASLVDWLRGRPMVARQGDRVMVHAGLHPTWTVDQAMELGAEIEELLRSSKPEQLLGVMYGNEPHHPSGVTTMEERWRLVINVMTRMRVLQAGGQLEFRYKSTYEEIEAPKMAWFDAPSKAWEGAQVICGHWSALGLRQRPDLLALDTGCRWGRHLTAVRLDAGAVFQVPSGLAGSTEK